GRAGPPGGGGRSAPRGGRGPHRGRPGGAVRTRVRRAVAAGAGITAAALVGRAVARRWVLSGRVRAELSERVERPPAPGAVRLSVVVPAYREADRIGATVARIRAELAPAVGPDGIEVVVV